MYTSSKISKKPHQNTSFFVFSQQNKFGPNFAPNTTPTLLFLADFKWNMLQDSININNLWCNPAVLKKIVFGTQFAQKRGLYGPCPKWKTLFLAKITKANHQLSETFYFIKISSILIELWIFFYIEWCFLAKNCISSENSWHKFC